MGTKVTRIELTETPIAIDTNRGQKSDIFVWIESGEALVMINSDEAEVVSPTLYTVRLNPLSIPAWSAEPNHTGFVTARAVSGTAVLMVTESE